MQVQESAAVPPLAAEAVVIPPIGLEGGPAQATFDFATADEFHVTAEKVLLGWREVVAGKAFFVRLYRRGFSGTLSVPVEERRLGDALLQAVAAGGNRGRITFDDPDAVVQIESIDKRAGLSVWTRNALRNYGFLGPL